MHDKYSLDLYYDRNSELKCVVPRKRIEVRGGEVNKGLTEKNLLVTYVKDKLAHISGARGCLTLQLFLNKENQDIHGIEINPRFGGGYPLSYLSGANFPKWLIQEYLFDQPIEYFEEWESNLLMLRYDDEVLVHGYGD
jgi:carbamoyl-phosphate synthase large subunit